MSRHSPHRRQIETLQETYGSDVVIEQEAKPFDDARQISRRFKEGGYDDMVLVAPLSVIAVLCGEEIKSLWSEAIEENDPAKIEFHGVRGQGFRFVRFRRLKRLALEFEGYPFQARAVL